MKRTSILLAAFLLSSPVVFGQGQIIFRNTSGTLISTNSVLGGPPNGPISSAVEAYYFGLFVAALGTTEPDAFVFTGNYATNTTTGRMSGGIPEIPGHLPGSTVALLVRGWSANIGTDYSAVLSYLANPSFDGWYGESQIGTNVLGLDNPPPLNLFGTFPGGIPGFTLELHTVPEPAATGLAALGLMAMWLSRRRSR